MKKFLSLLLAVAMIAAMASVSLAFEVVDGNINKSTVVPKDIYDKLVADKGAKAFEDGYPLNDRLIGPFGYNSDDKNLTLSPVEYGKTAYFLLTQYLDSAALPYELVDDSDTAKNVKLKGDWEEGKSLISGISVTKKKVNDVVIYDKTDKDNISTEAADATAMNNARNMLRSYGLTPGSYYYMVAISVKESSSTSDADIIGTLTVSKSKNPKADLDFDIQINVDWEQSYRNNSELVISGDTPILYAETYYSMKYEGDDEIEMSFADDSIFTVDISGQGKNLVYYDTNFNSTVANKFPLAELNFWNGNGAKFNRTGELFLSTGGFDDPYLYQINSDGSLSTVPGAEYDDSDEGFYFKTRTLGSYVYSDIELDITTTETTDESNDLIVTPVEPVTPVNPGTGARA